MSPETERALVEQAKGDPQAFALLYDHDVEQIYTFLYRRSGDADLAQEITAVAKPGTHFAQRCRSRDVTQ